MATNIQAGTIAVQINADSRQFHQSFVGVQKNFNDFRSYAQDFSSTVNNITPGFRGFWAHLRDGSMMAVALGQILNRLGGFAKGIVTDFSSFGDKISKMSQRTGIAARDLSLLGFAAEQCGASVDSIGDGFKYLSRNTVAAANGSKTALAMFSNLGIDFNKLKLLSKADQFRLIAEQIKKIGDESKQTDIAMKMFGRGGTSLLPLFQEGAAGIAKLMNEADTLGIGISEDDAKNAAALNDAMNRLSRSWFGVKNAIAAGISPLLVGIMDGVSSLIKSLRSAASGFSDLLKSITSVKIGADTLTASFASIPFFVTAPIAATAAWRGLATVFGPVINAAKSLTGILRPLLSLVVSFGTPFGILRTALVAAGSAFLYFSGTGSGVMRMLANIGNTVKSGFMSVFGDVAALVSKGDIAGAFQLQWLKIQLIFEQGKLSVSNTGREIFAALVEPFSAIYESVMSLVSPLWDSLVAGWNYASQAIGESLGWLSSFFGETWSYVKDGWSALTNDLGAVIVGGWWSIATGINEAMSWMQKGVANVLTWVETTFYGVIRAIIKAVGNLYSYFTGSGVPELLKKVEQNLTTNINVANAGNANYAAGVDQRKQAWQDSIDQSASRSLDRVADVKANAPQTTDRIEELKTAIAGLRTPKPAPEVAAANDKILDALTNANAGTTSAAVTGQSGGKTGTFNACEMGAVMGNTIEDGLKAQLKAAIVGNNILERIAGELENGGFA
ncbi:MAG: hypothetical protein LBU65_05480 [Planctomycetaceae bacterium]|jgi:hypothetical protein|nr:hypothetical protein [Planctomycetaceae bacterium]